MTLTRTPVRKGAKPKPRPRARRRARRGIRNLPRLASTALTLLVLFVIAAAAVAWARRYYTFTVRLPFRFAFQMPLIIEPKANDETTAEADQGGRRLTPYQAYACRKFGSACRVALAIQRAENSRGECEVYHYNTDGTLDWGYFQINTVHLKRPGLNLRDLLSCRANIDFAYQLYLERGFQPWSTYNSGAYRRFLRE